MSLAVWSRGPYPLVGMPRQPLQQRRSSSAHRQQLQLLVRKGPREPVVQRARTHALKIASRHANGLAAQVRHMSMHVMGPAAAGRQLMQMRNC